MSSSPLRALALGRALAFALLPAAAGAHPVGLPPILTLGERATSASVEGAAPDTDLGSGMATTESLARVEQGNPNPYTWFASALVEGEANLEVGVDLTRPACCVTGSSLAYAELEFSYTNPHDHPVHTPQGGLLLPAGEVLFRLPSTLEPVAGQDRGYFYAAIYEVGTPTPLFFYKLELVTTDGGFEEGPSSTSNVAIDQIMNGSGGVWGYTTLPADIDFDLPSFAANETKNFLYVMSAYGENFFQHGEVGAGFSVKLGDPFDATFGGGLKSITIPEPGTLSLLTVGLAALAAARGRRPTLSGLAAGPARSAR